MTWEDTMWEELDEKEPLAQHVAAGEWITMMQQTLVPALAERRRAKLVEAAELVDNDYYLLAEQIGSRKGAIERLVNEGRAARRDREQHRDSE